MGYMKHLKANWKVAFHSFNDFLEHFIHGLLPCIKWEHKQPAILPNKTIFPKSTNCGGCLQCKLQTEKEEEESLRQIQEAKNAAMPKLIEIDNDFKAGKITAFESIRRGYFAILEQEVKILEKKLADNKKKPEVKAFFEKIRKENKNGSTSLCE